MSSDSELSDFSELSNDDENINVVYSQYTLYRIAISQSCPQHYVIRTFWLRDSKTIFESIIAQFSGVIKSTIFFKHGSNFGIVSEKLISLHMHFNTRNIVLLHILIQRIFGTDKQVSREQVFLSHSPFNCKGLSSKIIDSFKVQFLINKF